MKSTTIKRIGALRFVSGFLIALTVLAAWSGFQVAGASPPSLNKSEIDSYILAQLTAKHIPGISVAIVQDDDIVYLQGFGLASVRKQTPVTPQTVFDLASCSKSFTAIAVLLLEQDGYINLDASLVTYLKEFRLADVNTSSLITVRELLNQTSGLPGIFSEPLAYHNGADAMQRLVASMAFIKSDREPGSSFEYTNLNYSLLGALVERVSGMPFEDYVQQHIFTPLGMKNTTLRPEIAASGDRADGHQLLLGRVVARNTPIFRSIAPAGWVMSSAADMARWISVNLNGGIIDGKQVIPASIIYKMQTAGVDLVRDGKETGYGMGWFVGNTPDGEKVVWHSGDTTNFLAETILLPEEKLGIVMLVNGQTTASAHDVALGILGIIRGKELTLPTAPWWSSWKSIDNISIDATILSAILLLGLVPFIWWQVRLIHRLRKRTPHTGKSHRRIKLWVFVVPATPWVIFSILLGVAYAVMQSVFGFNIFRVLVRFGYFAPPGVIIAAIAFLGIIFLWAIALSVTTIFRAQARAL